MNKFWVAVGILISVALLLLFVENVTLPGNDDPEQITFDDIETECRVDSFSRISSEGDRVHFEGAFDVEGTDSRPSYTFSVSGDRVVLDVRSTGGQNNETFWDDCLASIYYDGTTDRVEPGEYTAVVQHNGEQVDSRRVTLTRP